MDLVDAGNGMDRSARWGKTDTPKTADDLIWVSSAFLFFSLYKAKHSLIIQHALISITRTRKDPTMALKEEEAAVYDRQLRVWGVETQRK